MAQDNVQDESSPIAYRCMQDGVRHYAKQPIMGADCVGIRRVQPTPAQQLVGPPSILPQCLDTPHGSMLVGPSARARECTRLYCAQAAYRTKVTAYALSKPQSESDQLVALTCITRKEQDLRNG
nr:putative integron gene cassette protein [uncultured bacterium]